MTDNISCCVDDASASFEYFASIDAYVFPVDAQTKRPFPGFPWKRLASNDPDQWGEWWRQYPSCGWAMFAAKSRLLVADIDVKNVGTDMAQSTWADECRKAGLAEPLAPNVTTPSGGAHIYLRLPDGFDETTLAQSAWVPGIIDVRTAGYVLIPPSARDGRAYTLVKSKIEPCPVAFLEKFTHRIAPDAKEREARNDFDFGLMSSVVRWTLANTGRLDNEYDWVFDTLAIRDAFPDERGYQLACEMAYADQQERLDGDVWVRQNDYRGNPRTCATLIKYARDNGYTGRTAHEMFGDHIAALPASPSIVPTLPPGAVPMFGPGARQPQIVAPEYGDTELAQRFADSYATQLRYVTSRAAWIYWNGSRWTVDETDYVADLAKRHCQSEAAICSGTPGQTAATARAVCSKRTVSAVLDLARTDQRIASRASDWDQDPWLLGTPDGIVDLRTGTLRAAAPEDHVTKSTAVSPAGDCPTWLAFLHRATGGDIERQAYLQRVAGYCLTGSTREQALFFAFGPGRTGKGTFMHPIASILKDYHVTTAIETLTESRGDRHPTELASLQGARLVTCSETERGRHWAESRIKQLTGDDEISARFMNQNFFTFRPTFKLLISGNYKPALRPDSAMRRRFNLIPFDVAIPEPEVDANLSARLEKEWPGILAWMIAGAVEWQRDGLRTPEIIRDATSEYMDDEAEDCLSAWIGDRCVLARNVETPARDLYISYARYADQSGEQPMTETAFGKELGNLGFAKKRTDAARLRIGIALRTVAPPPMPPLPPIVGGAK